MSDVYWLPTCQDGVCWHQVFQWFTAILSTFCRHGEKVLASVASQAIVFESLSANLVPLCPHCFNPAFLSHIDPCAE